MAEQDTDRGYTPAKQARSRKTEQKFLDAAEVAFAKNGFAGSRIADIISASGASTGSFYHRFSDKRDLFEVMLARIWEALAHEAREMDLSKETFGSLANLLTHYADHSYTTIRAHIGFYRAAYEISAQDPDVWERLKELSLVIGDRFAEVAETYADEIELDDKQQAIRHAVQVIITMAIHTSLGSGPLFPADHTELRAVVVRAALGVLR
ncbi:TetR/AcrR family transcriptional regulator [Falsiruegeria litorea]|uniref:TetR/AcrR family transcriptional regulator n=1 Tax=Falsiruegeria litorea TaxID=1280831 RepID=UPI0013FDB6DA|nr:TetR/AcrR family transcriptional regulator [Falsiruegeria litorea]